MNCPECQQHLIAHMEGLLDGRREGDLVTHLQACPTCQSEATEHAGLRERLDASGKTFARRTVLTSVMDRIVQQPPMQLRKITMQKRYGKAGLGLAVAAAIAAAFIPWSGSPKGEATAAQVFAQAIEALSDLQSVYIKLNVRTIPHDNFASIATEYPFAPHEMWKEFGDTPKYRVEKPGRTAAMDGESSVLLINVADQRYLGNKSGPDANFVGWMKRLLDVDQVLNLERRSAERNGWDLQLTKETGPDGYPKLVVTVEAKALGDFANDWMKNKTISASDQRRVYRFDADTKRLEDLELWVHGEEEDVLVLDIVEIVYDPKIDSVLWTLDVPQGTIWHKKPEVLPDNDKYVRMPPEEVARTFFQALADQDWDEALKFYPWSDFSPATADTYGGLTILSIGKPFQSGDYPGWFVPYVVQLKTGWLGFGAIKRHNLALNNTHGAGRYVVDGGF